MKFGSWRGFLLGAVIIGWFAPAGALAARASALPILALEPPEGEVSAGTKIAVRARARDSRGDAVPASLQISLSSTGGNNQTASLAQLIDPNSDGTTYTATFVPSVRAGDWAIIKVEGDVGGRKLSAIESKLTTRPADPMTLEISPQEVRVFPGDTVKFSASAADVYGNKINKTVEWSAGLNQISQKGKLIATESGEDKVTARLENLSAEAKVIVEPRVAGTSDSQGPFNLLWLLPLVLLIISGLFAPGLAHEIAGFLVWPFLMSRKRWGRVLTGDDNRALALVRVNLIDERSGRTVGRCLTGLAGNFGFKVEAGHYRLQVLRPGFQFSLAAVPGYPRAYQGKIIAIKHWGNYPKDLEIVATPLKDNDRIVRFLWWLICFVLIATGGWLAGQEIVKNFNWLNIVTLALYLIGFIFLIYKKIPRPMVD